MVGNTLVSLPDIGRWKGMCMSIPPCELLDPFSWPAVLLQLFEFGLGVRLSGKDKTFNSFIG